MIISRILGKKDLGPGVELTVGGVAKTWKNEKYREYILSNSNILVEKNQDEFHYDYKNNILSVPGLLKIKNNLFKVHHSINSGIDHSFKVLNKLRDKIN